ncbi:MAG: CHAD domain-containing protein [Planctomycetota bacterium]
MKGTVTTTGPTDSDLPSDVPGLKWFARYESSSGPEAARSLLDERTSRLARCIELARGEPVGKRIRKLRVATRRADMAVRFVSPLCDKRAAKRARRALQSLRRAGGAVRRCDVFIARLRETASAAPGQDIGEASIALIGRLGAERGVAQRAFVEAVASDNAITALKAIDLREDNGNETTSEMLAMTMLRDAGADFAQTSTAAALDFEGLHDFRLRVKRLRYAAESAAPVIGDVAAASLIAAAAPLQDELGTINDLAELAAELSVFHADMADLPGVGKLRSGLDRMLLAASSERDRRAIAFGRHRKSRIAPVTEAVAGLKPRTALRLADDSSQNADTRSETA